MFLAVRLGLPIGLALLGLVCATLLHSSRGWWLLLSVACLAEASQAFQQGATYLRHRAAIVHRDGLWVKAFRPMARLLGWEDAWIRSFLAWNNYRIEEVFAVRKARKALVMLPHCIQLSRCKAGVTEDLESCYHCDQCPVGDILESSLAGHWKVCIFNRSHKAARHAKEYKPDLMVAVSCSDRLLKGILKLPEIPCFGIPLDLPRGMCVDTTFDPSLLEQAMAHLVRPRAETPDNIQPLQTSETA
ncbi:DUF116 domain-containing protein [Holophaga foetida]|uniref:DUF116 domain-containing protein n=1 Tax=Holophaga foetida TaxID=35839 RepID=UPI0002474D6F|nr:DUF116 domain-containing protein [Holophaga foetida]